MTGCQKYTISVSPELPPITVIVLNINVGDAIRIISGPFKGFTGTVEDVHPDKQTLRAKVDMFGRATPVELEFDQVDQIG